MVKMLAELHNIDYKKVSLGDFGNLSIMLKDKLLGGKNNGIYLSRESYLKWNLLLIG